MLRSFIRLTSIVLALGAAAGLFAARSLAAQGRTAAARLPQPAGEPKTPQYRFEPVFRNWTRIEAWRFFQPPPGGGDPEYTTAANRLLAGVRHTGPRHEVNAAMQYVQFGGLPTAAFGPGALGTGAIYFDHNRRTDSRQVYLRTLNLQVPRILPGLDLRVGRMGYASGAESASGDAAIESLKRMRLDSRLIGEFEWSLYQRAFDGVRLAWSGTPAVHATFSALWPTQGGFEEQAGRSLGDVRVIGGTVTGRPSPTLRRTELQAFVLEYRDTRPVAARPDNTGRPAAAVEIDVTTVGGSLAGAYPVRTGRVDALAWTALQTGTWYDQSHGAVAVALEAGHQWTTRAWRPWVRIGWNRASGDSDGSDGEHGTFFPMLPTGRRYSLSATYASMNLDDRFAQLIVRPHAGVSVRADLHRLRLAEAADLWYAGSGATRREGTIFGYAGRRSGGGRSLGTVIEGAADWIITRHWSVNAYAGRILGGDVVRASFAGDRLTFAYVENVLQFP